MQNLISYKEFIVLEKKFKYMDMVLKSIAHCGSFVRYVVPSTSVLFAGSNGLSFGL